MYWIQIKNNNSGDSFHESALKVGAMLEYIFFHETPWRRFTESVEQLGLSPETSVEEDEWLVMLPEDLDDELDEQVEALYDRCLEMNESLVAEEEGEDHVHRAGINVTLGDGRVVQAAVDPKLVTRILDVVSIEELGDLVNAVVDAVENPNDRPLCQR
jgi:hypothetical protein